MKRDAFVWILVISHYDTPVEFYNEREDSRYERKTSYRPLNDKSTATAINA